ncbi:hypothetical protein [Arthrobacter sp. BE255]|uniref:hypothetical protein n=1 Tax=Arthrobacter sp. BE255 TaxID=2817721 RepID=UPI0028656A72|nr:hypothetical protein [Arthrobacter sp. BE255]MDR7161775.1 hypothetical protein [Arthrobacter sp. BE255]
MKLGREPVSDQTWEAIRAEFALPSLGQVSSRLSELMEDPEPVMQQLVRVFIDEGTFCPGFQFLAGGQLHPTVVDLFKRAMELKIPHNYFTVWMVTPAGSLGGSRPVDLLDGGPQPLFDALETLGKELSPAANRSRSVGV